MSKCNGQQKADTRYRVSFSYWSGDKYPLAVWGRSHYNTASNLKYLASLLF
nr:hypothetical protein [Aliivibrio sp. 1S128]